MVFLKHFAPDLKIVSQYDWWPTRDEEAEYAYKNKIPSQTARSNHSATTRTLGQRHQYGDIDDIGRPSQRAASNGPCPSKRHPTKLKASPSHLRMAYPPSSPARRWTP
jgi:argininosuccinate synthase